MNNYVEFQKHEKNSYSTNHLFIIKVNKNIHKALFNNLRKKKIYVQLHYIPIYRQPYYKKKFNFNLKNFKNSEDYYSRAISIPIYFSLTHKKQLKIIELINSFLEKKK